MPNAIKRAAFTLAVGKRLYLQMAINLARSFLLWHRNSDIRFFIVTDSPDPLPPDLAGVTRIQLQPQQYGSGFSPKLYLDLIAPGEENLFIDADCLCVANLDAVFDKFQGQEVSVIGRKETEGELFGDIAERCKAVGVSWVPRFCGGIYYLKRGAMSGQVFRRARELEKRYDELGITRLRGAANEEPLLGLAMALTGQQPLLEDGSIKAEPMFFSARTDLDVFSGLARLSNVPGAARPYPEWNMPAKAFPAIVHFNCSFAEQPPYTTEAVRLEKVFQDGWPLWGATVYARFKCSWLFLLEDRIKGALRPIYHALFGYRPVKRSARLG